MKSERKSDYLGYCKHTDLHGKCFFSLTVPAGGLCTYCMPYSVLTVADFPLPNELFLPWRRRNKVLISFRILKV